MKTQAQALQRAADHFRAYEKGAMGNDSFTELAEMCEEVIAARPYQQRIRKWMLDCFGPTVGQDETTRADRFLEEVFELLQAMGYDFGRIAEVQSYVAGRPVGEKSSEVGGVLVTLFGLCCALEIDAGAAAEAEYERISTPEVMARVRAKQASKPFGSPVP